MITLNKTELLSNWDMKNFIQDTHFDAYRGMDLIA